MSLIDCSLLADYSPGDYGEAELNEGEKRLTVRNRFKAAARRGLGLTFQPTRGNVMRFRVAPTAVEPEPPPTPQAAPGAGRRRLRRWGSSVVCASDRELSGHSWRSEAKGEPVSPFCVGWGVDVGSGRIRTFSDGAVGAKVVSWE